MDDEIRLYSFVPSSISVMVECDKVTPVEIDCPCGKGKVMSKPIPTVTEKYQRTYNILTGILIGTSTKGYPIVERERETVDYRGNDDVITEMEIWDNVEVFETEEECRQHAEKALEIWIKERGLYY